MSEKIEISFEDFLNEYCTSEGCYSKEFCLRQNLKLENTECGLVAAAKLLDITIKVPKTKLEEANEIELLWLIYNPTGERVYKAEHIDKKISLLMEYIKELESKK